MPNDEYYYVQKSESGRWAVVRTGTPGPAAIFSTQAEAVAYADWLVEMCAPPIEPVQHTRWKKLLKSCR
ncbi:MAG TPA: DUF2188 domain-containing protein [Edaphobacter sp.]|nr:DUF2188 domain-containing protein [Edaphobacter sp.]